MNLRVVFWEESGENLKSLDECHLKLHTIFVPFNAKMNQIEPIIKEKRKEALKDFKEDICVVKRHQNDEYSYHEVINVNDYQ